MCEDPLENVRRHLHIKYRNLPDDVRNELIERILMEMSMIIEFSDRDKDILVTDAYIEFRGEEDIGNTRGPEMIQEFLVGFLEVVLAEEIPEREIEIPPVWYDYIPSTPPCEPEEIENDEKDEPQDNHENPEYLDMEPKDQYISNMDSDNSDPYVSNMDSEDDSDHPDLESESDTEPEMEIIPQMVLREVD